MTHWFWPENPIWSWMLSRPLGESVYGGGTAHDILQAAQSITPGDGESWYRAFHELAERANEMGQAAVERQKEITGRKHWLRAFNYYRWSEAFLDNDDSRRQNVFRKALTCFDHARSLFPSPVERINIPFGEELLPGYFFHSPVPPASKTIANESKTESPERKSPVLISIAGADVYKEALYFLGGAAALQRGFSVLVYDGPGQGEMGRLHRTSIRPDYEHVLAAAVDYLESRPDVDLSRIVLLGRSFAGYYACRALAFERRIRAAVIFGAFYDAVEVFDFYPPLRTQFQRLLQAKNLEETRSRLAEFRLTGLLERVSTPTWVLHGEDDFLVPVSHACRTYHELAGEKRLHVFPSGQPGAHHCQHDLLHVVLPDICDWLYEQVNISGEVRTG